MVTGQRKERLIRKKRRKRRLLIWSILIPILLFVSVGFAYAFDLYSRAQSVVDGAYENDGRERSNLREFDVDPGSDHVSILFIGVDESDHRDNSGRSLSDALILATLNKDENSVKLLSVPRDSYVYIPEVGYKDKINHAHAFGGPIATIEALEGLLDIPIDYWVRLNFHAFVDVVDALGGVTFDVPYEFKESNSDDRRNSIHLMPGVQTVDGEEALALARTRKLDSDLHRGRRQQELMHAIFDKAVSIGSINKIGDVIDAVGDNMATNLNFNQLMSFASYGLSGNLNLESINIEGNDLWLANSRGQEIYYFELDETQLNEKKKLLQEHLDITSPSVTTGTESFSSNSSES